MHAYNAAKSLACTAVFACILAACQASVHAPPSIGVSVQADLRTPLPWRELTEDEQSIFDLGYAVFNTGWTPANNPPGRRDGLGPLFNAPSCDACHNSRRRGRGPRGNGEAPLDLVIQLGRRLPDGSVVRGSDEYGFILNTAAVSDASPEAAVRIEYSYTEYELADGTEVDLYTPHYQISSLSGGALPDNTVLMPRMPPSLQGVGLLELVPETAIVALAKQSSARKRATNVGKVSWLQMPHGPTVGRFGWQATEPTIAKQTASAFSREMGLTTSLVKYTDCGLRGSNCLSAATGGSPEVELELFGALVHFQKLHAVPSAPVVTPTEGEHLFAQLGCANCHRLSLPVQQETSSNIIHPYTDLLLHDLGEALADRDLAGNAVRSVWRTAPLWGMQAAVTSGQPLRLLHDGRARSLEEAILWHDGEARDARESFTHLSARERRILTDWVADR